jgi:G3E family GTPase
MCNVHEPKEKSIQHVILETTGLADPTPILQLIAQGADKKGTDDIVQNYYINGIVTLIDAKYFHQTLSSISSSTSQYKNEIIAQILTTDLLSNQQQELNEIQQFIHQHNTNVKIIPTSFAKLPVGESIFNLRPERDSIETVSMIQTKAAEEALKKHDPSIEQTMVLASGDFVDLSAVQEFIKQTTKSGDIYRIKGILYLKENPNKKFVIQGVNQDQLSIIEGGDWQSDEVKESRVAFIGKNVLGQCQSLETEFQKCLL